MRSRILAGLLFILPIAAHAYDFEPVKSVDPRELEAGLTDDLYGTWEIRSSNGRKRCRVNLLREFGIGGFQIEVAPNCAKAYPVMADVSAWQLIEGFGIEFINPLRKTLIRFETPDNPYVAFGDEKDIADMDEFLKIEDKKAKPARTKK